MQRNWMIRVALFAMLACFAGIDARADVFSGTIVSVDAAAGRVVVKARSQDVNRSFSVTKSAQVTIEGKTALLAKVKPGQTVSVFYTESVASRLIVRDAKDEEKPADEPVKPKPTTKPDPRKPTAKTKPEEPADTPKPEPTVTPVTPAKPTEPTRPGRNTPPAERNEAAKGDWPQFRGPNRDNKSTETGLLKEWPSNGPELAWSVRGLGEGYSSVAIADGKVVTMGDVSGRETVTAVDLKTGDRLWASPIGNGFRQGAGNGPRGTPSIVDGKVYALGASGQLACLDLATGRESWSKNILQEYGGNNIVWGISESPLVDGEKVIVTPGGSRATMVALNKDSGNQIWASQVPSAPQTSYSSVLAITVGGVRQYVNFTQAGVVGIRAADGTPMWGQRESANGTANCSSPIFFDNQIFTASGYGTGGALFRLQSRGNQTTSQLAYTTREMVNHHGGMVEKDGFLYGSNENIFACINLKTGQPTWRSRDVGKGSVTYADGLLYCRSEQGPVVLVEANPESFVEKARFSQPQRSNQQSWAHPVVADGKLFLRDQDGLLVYDVKAD